MYLYSVNLCLKVPIINMGTTLSPMYIYHIGARSLEFVETDRVLQGYIGTYSMKLCRFHMRFPYGFL